MLPQRSQNKEVHSAFGAHAQVGLPLLVSPCGQKPLNLGTHNPGRKASSPISPLDSHCSPKLPLQPFLQLKTLPLRVNALHQSFFLDPPLESHIPAQAPKVNSQAYGYSFACIRIITNNAASSTFLKALSITLSHFILTMGQEEGREERRNCKSLFPRCRNQGSRHGSGKQQSWIQTYHFLALSPWASH